MADSNINYIVWLIFIILGMLVILALIAYLAGWSWEPLSLFLDWLGG